MGECLGSRWLDAMLMQMEMHTVGRCHSRADWHVTLHVDERVKSRRPQTREQIGGRHGMLTRYIRGLAQGGFLLGSAVRTNNEKDIPVTW